MHGLSPQVKQRQGRFELIDSLCTYYVVGHMRSGELVIFFTNSPAFRTEASSGGPAGWVVGRRGRDRGGRHRVAKRRGRASIQVGLLLQPLEIVQGLVDRLDGLARDSARVVEVAEQPEVLEILGRLELA